MRRILSRRICNVHRAILYFVFSARVRKQLLPEQFSIRVAPRGMIFENREGYRSIYDRATLISGLQRVAISGMDARDEMNGRAISRRDSRRERPGNANSPLRSKRSNFAGIAILSKVQG